MNVAKPVKNIKRKVKTRKNEKTGMNSEYI
jgi:hypothetical protein